MREGYTTIEVSRGVQARLKLLGSKDESYDTILRRILELPERD